MIEGGHGEMIAAGPAGSPAARMPDDALSAPERLLDLMGAARSVMRRALMMADDGLPLDEEWRHLAAKVCHLLNSEEARADIVQCEKIGFGKCNRPSFGIPQAMDSLNLLARPGVAVTVHAKRGIGDLRNDIIAMICEFGKRGASARISQLAVHREWLGKGNADLNQGEG